MESNKQGLFLIGALFVLALGIAYAGGQIQTGLTEFKSYDRSVRMKGLATRDVEANIALWPISYKEAGNDLQALQEVMDAKGRILVNFFKKQGITDAEIEKRAVTVQDLLAQAYRQNNIGPNRYIITQSYLVRSENIEAITKAAANVGDLIKQGIVLSQAGSSAPTYLFTKLNDVKPEMIAEATQSAREAAKEFSKQTGQKVGDIKRASQGVFQILPRDATYTVPESQQRNKTVRVVSTIEFYLE
ncbi:MAG: SIMPL domain-containing protein [Micavibrio sp.]|nr:SIMPL domain-containing protein [Micavibrio sp.]